MQKQNPPTLKVLNHGKEPLTSPPWHNSLAAMDSTNASSVSSLFPECFRDLGFHPPTRLHRKWTHVDGLGVHSWRTDAVASTPFVLLHGLVISSLYMLPLAERLGALYSVHAIDLPGFGRSPGPRHTLNVPELAEFVVKWLSAANIATCHLVANSLGCQIAAHIAVHAPERVQTLTLIGATIDPNAYSLPKQILRLVRDAIHEPPRLWVNWLFDFARAGIPRAVRTTREMFRDRIEQQLPRIRQRTLVIRGERDPTMPAHWAQQATALLPDGHLVTIRRHSHCVHYTDPAAVADAIIAHIRETPAPADVR